MKEFEEFLAEYWKVLVPQPKPGIDVRGLPDYPGGPWLPWLTVNGELLSRSTRVR